MLELEVLDDDEVDDEFLLVDIIEVDDEADEVEVEADDD